jgi:hypothetical protein
MTKTEYRNEWESRVVNFKSSGMGVTVWCKANNVNKERFKYWLYKNNKPTITPAAKTSKQWIAIETAPVALNKQESILIINIGQASIQIKPGFDAVLLGDVVKALAGRC